MDKFMLIFHGGSHENMSPDEMQTSMGKWMAWVEKLTQNGQYVSGEPLLPGGKLVSGSKGRTVTDGPYTEGKEVVGGYFIINAKDVDDAVAISKECPDLDSDGSVQIRQVMLM